jgi:glycosyltransferase 2 family protein
MSNSPGAKGRVREFLGYGLGLAVVALIVLFFRGEFSRNWERLKTVALDPDYPLLAVSFLLILASYLVNTQAWRFGVNLLATGRKFTFAEGIGMVNTTQLTKYIPGKVWGYAMQMVLVDKKSISPSVVLYVNLFLALSNVFVSLLVGGAYLATSSSLLPRQLSALASVALVLAYLFFLLFNQRFFALLLRAMEVLLKKRIASCEVAFPDIARLQAFTLANVALFGLSALACYLGLGFSEPSAPAFTMIAGLILADAVGFLMVFVPGGIGVREGLLYVILKERGAEALALILPIALRLVSMLVDAVLGLIGLVFLKNYMKKDAK